MLKLYNIQTKKYKDLQNKYGNQIEILAGSGINASNARKMMEDTGISGTKRSR